MSKVLVASAMAFSIGLEASAGIPFEDPKGVRAPAGAPC